MWSLSERAQNGALLPRTKISNPEKSLLNEDEYQEARSKRGWRMN